MTRQPTLALALALFALAGALQPAWADAPHPGATPAPRLVLAPQKPNGSGIQVHYSVPSRLKPDQATAVQLQLSRVTGPDAQVQLRGSSPALQLTVGGVAVSGPLALARGETRQLEVQISAPEGVHFLTVLTQQNGRSSAQSIELKVGQATPRLKHSGTASTTPSGEKVISLPSSR